MVGWTENHTIPSKYGAVQPTAVFVPLRKLMQKKYFKLATTEVFGPFQVRCRVVLHRRCAPWGTVRQCEVEDNDGGGA